MTSYSYENIQQNKKLEFLITGDTFHAYDEDLSNAGDAVKLRLHISGLFIIWSSFLKSKVLDCCHVRDIRVAPITNKSNDDTAIIQFCCGTDFVNLSLINFGHHCRTTVDNWVNTLYGVVFDLRLSNLSPLEIIKKQYLMISSTTDTNGETNLNKLLRFFHGKMSEKKITKMLIEEKVLSPKGDEFIRVFDETLFMELIDKIVERPDIEEIFKQFSNESEVITLEALKRFINETQRDSRLNTILFPLLKSEECLQIIEKYECNRQNIKNKCLSLNAFQKYIMSEENMAVPMVNHMEPKDLTQPLSHYFINSSHNTYLLGRQFGGKSSVEIYRTILLSGCRCVELDCWDGVDGEPIITHGMAACTIVLFKDVIKAISETAFITSDLPVILSFENHCSYKLQKKMVDYCIEIFGDLLLKESLPDYPLVAGVDSPSPDHLKRKIIIKNKKLSDNKEVAKGNNEAVISLNIDNKLDDVTEVIKTYKRQRATTTVHPELSSVINYIQSVKFAGFDSASDKNSHFHVSSFAENTGNGLLKNSSIEFVHYNKRQFSRIYPKGARFDSSNYFPQLFWNAGCQMVALNFQTVGGWMQLNQGRFEYYGNSGYVLKPLCMRNEDFVFDPFTEASVDGIIAAQCSVKVISAQFLSEKRTSSYVEVEMYGLATDTIRKEFRTKIVNDNGINPIYKDEAFVFRKIVLPELAMLKIAVYDGSSGKLVGQRHLPLECIQNGYRYVTLRSESNTPLNLPMVLCHFGLSIYIPDEHEGIADALFDPSKFMSNSEKAKKMLNDLGVEDSDIEEDYNMEHGDYELSLPTVDELKMDTEYMQLEKKYFNQLDLFKSHCYKRRSKKSRDQCGLFIKNFKRHDSNLNSAEMVKLNEQQILEWKKFIQKQESKVIEKNQEILKELNSKLIKLAKKSHDNLRKSLNDRLESSANEMIQRQTREMADTSKVKNVTKHEKSRIIKEMKDSLVKKFIEERKIAGSERARLQTYWNQKMENQLNEINELYETQSKNLSIIKYTLDTSFDEACI